MLINIVILTLRDLLPLTILFMWLSAYISPTFFTIKTSVLILLSSLLGILFFFNFAPVFSDYFDGAGMEFILVLLIITLYISLLIGSVLSLNSRQSKSIACCALFLGVCCLSVMKGTNFVIYLNGYINRSNDNISIFIGVLVALGIGISFSTLYYFILRWCTKKSYQTLLNILWAMFITGLLSHLVQLLSQVDIISNTQQLWDSRMFIEDNSEYGHILKALVGYEATPSMAFVMIYLLGHVSFPYGLKCFQQYFYYIFLQTPAKC